MKFRSPLFQAAAFGLTILISACGGERAYDVRGRVAGFGADNRTIIVEHEEIAGLMPAMTMPFKTVDTTSVGRLSHGDAIGFRLVLASDSSWITDIRRLPDDALPEHPSSTADPQYDPGQGPAHLDSGDLVPSTTLHTHADTTLDLSMLRGKAVVLTFVYTRCPLPEYCPLMARNLSELQPRISDAYGSRVHLLTVSIDPEHDTPDVLRQYARRYTSDLSSWTFATGNPDEIRDFATRFGVYYRTESGEIMHNLTTALIGPDGRIRRLWRGNEWQPEQILSSLEQLEISAEK